MAWTDYSKRDPFLDGKRLSMIAKMALLDALLPDEEGLALKALADAYLQITRLESNASGGDHRVNLTCE